MANTRRQSPEKVSADCPHCGYSQLESAIAKSTFCRKCGEHYSIEKLLAKEASSLEAPGLFDRFRRLISRETEREVLCFACQAPQVVSSAAESTQCPKCGSYIDLRDFKISGPFGRSIQTQGEVYIGPKGDATSQRILCGEARVEGKMRGQMICTGTIAVRVTGKLQGSMEGGTVVVEKKSDIEFVRPLKAKNVQIDGHVKGQIHCDGRVTINKKGVLEGTVYAKSIVVEKGGIFSGNLVIGEIAAVPEAAPAVAAEQPLSEGSKATPAPTADQEALVRERKAQRRARAL